LSKAALAVYRKKHIKRPCAARQSPPSVRMGGSLYPVDRFLPDGYKTPSLRGFSLRPRPEGGRDGERVSLVFFGG